MENHNYGTWNWWNITPKILKKELMVDSAISNMHLCTWSCLKSLLAHLFLRFPGRIYLLKWIWVVALQKNRFSIEAGLVPHCVKCGWNDNQLFYRCMWHLFTISLFWTSSIIIKKVCHHRGFWHPFSDCNIALSLGGALVESGSEFKGPSDYAQSVCEGCQYPVLHCALVRRIDESLTWYEVVSPQTSVQHMSYYCSCLSDAGVRPENQVKASGWFLKILSRLLTIADAISLPLSSAQIGQYPFLVRPTIAVRL